MKGPSEKRVASTRHGIPLTATLYECPESGRYTAVCNEIKGGISEGDTIEEALANLRDAVEGLLEVNAEIAAETARECKDRKVITRPFMQLCEAS